MTSDQLGPNPDNEPLTMLDYAEQVLNPDMAVPGIMVVDGDDLPDDRELGRQVRSKLLMATGHVKPDVLSPRRVVVVDESRPDMVPEILKNVTGEERREWIGGLTYDIIINLLNVPDDDKLGEMVRERLMEDEKIHNPGSTTDDDLPPTRPGFYDPSDHNEPRPGEQRAWLVVAGS